MTKETTKLIIEWFAHIEQMARDRKTQTGAVMNRQHCLDEIAVLASECKQYVEEFQHEQEPINEGEIKNFIKCIKTDSKNPYHNAAVSIGVNYFDKGFDAGYRKASEG